MAEPTIYAVKADPDCADRLYRILHLAKIGAAATDTTLNLDNLNSAQCSLFEVIHRLADEALVMAEAGRMEYK